MSHTRPAPPAARFAAPALLALAAVLPLSARAAAQAQRPRLVVQTGEEGSVGYLRFIRDGKTLVSVGDTFKLWDVRTGRELRRQPANARSFAVNGDGCVLARQS